MSQNLQAATKKGSLVLWQTPTQISYTILPEGPSITKKGREAREALSRYAAWVEHSINRSYETLEALVAHQKNVKDHLEYLRGFLQDPSLIVWIE